MEVCAAKVRRFVLLLFVSLVIGFPLVSHAQGCSLCKDATAGSAPRAREGLRRAILVLGIPAGAIFLAILVIAGRIQPMQQPDGNPTLDAFTAGQSS